MLYSSIVENTIQMLKLYMKTASPEQKKGSIETSNTPELIFAGGNFIPARPCKFENSGYAALH